MPAIQPARLKQQAAHLAEYYRQPEIFLREAHALFDFYAERARRPPKGGRPRPLLPAYHLPPPVLRAIVVELTPQLRHHPQAALALCDALWKEPYYECRLLAILLFGRLDPNPPEPLLQRLNTWLTPDLEMALLEPLLATGLEQLSRQQPQALLDWIQTQLEKPQPFNQQVGLRALLPLIRDPAFENLPLFYRLITPLYHNPHSRLRPDLIEVLSALARRSPQETAYFLRQVIQQAKSEDTLRLVRRSLSALPPEFQSSLLHALRRAVVPQQTSPAGQQA